MTKIRNAKKSLFYHLMMILSILFQDLGETEMVGVLREGVALGFVVLHISHSLPSLCFSPSRCF